MVHPCRRFHRFATQDERNTRLQSERGDKEQELESVVDI